MYLKEIESIVKELWDINPTNWSIFAKFERMIQFYK